MFNSAKAASAKKTPNLQPIQNAITAMNSPAQHSNPISMVNSAPKFSPVSSGAPFSVPAFKPQITKPKEARQEEAPATQNSFSSLNTSGGLSFGAPKTQGLSLGESKGFGFGSPASR